MKTTLLLSCLFIQLFILKAQNRLTFYTVDKSPFYLYIDNMIYNNWEPSNSITIQNIDPANYNIRIVPVNTNQYSVLTLSILDEYEYVYKLIPVQGSLRPGSPFIGNKYLIKLKKMEEIVDPYCSDPYNHNPTTYNSPLPPPPPAVAPLPTPNDQFQNILNSIQNQTFNENKLKVAKQIVSTNLLSVDQIRKIMKLFPFDDAKLEFSKYAYQYVYDPKNYYLLSSDFYFSSDAEELMEYIATQ